MLILAGGWFDGSIALVTVALIGSHACCELIVTRKVRMSVPSTVTNVHDTGPPVCCPSRSMVIVPVQVPSRKERAGEGPVTLGARPQDDSAIRQQIHSAQRMCF